jgi:hypothetical protein
MPERIACQLEEIRSCAAAMMRIAPNDEVGRIASTIAEAASRLLGDPWDETRKIELSRAVVALELALEPVPLQGH